MMRLLNNDPYGLLKGLACQWLLLAFIILNSIKKSESNDLCWLSSSIALITKSYTDLSTEFFL